MRSFTHCVHFFQADVSAFVQSVVRYLRDGLSQNEIVFVIANGSHREEFAKELRSLGADPDAAIRDQRLFSLDSEWLLSRFTVNGQLQQKEFELALEPLLRQVKKKPVRVYGDMVGVLWRAGRCAAALQLEQFWEDLLSRHPFQLYCGYPIDVFSPEFGDSEVRQLMAVHSHVVPTGINNDLASALDQAAGELLEPAVRAEVDVLSTETKIPSAEGRILSLRARSNRADEIMDRARGYYRQDKRFRYLVEHLYDAIALIDAQAAISYASASTLRVLGYKPNELVGTNGFDLVHPDDHPQVREALEAAALTPGSPVQVRAQARHKNGGWIWTEVSATNLLEQSEIAAIVINYRDISQQVASEEGTRRIAGQLAQIRQERFQVARAVSDNVMNSVRKIRSFGHILTESGSADDSSRRFAQYVEENAKQVSDLLSDLVLLMGIEGSPPRSNVHLGKVAADAVDQLAPLIRETSAVIEVGEFPTIEANESQMRALFQNLIENAIKFRGPEAPHIAISSQRMGSDWIVKVQDNGLGIPEAYREFIFGIFARLPNAGIAGRGTGLALCRKIVDLLGGKIWADPNPTGGSIFCIAIPIPAAT
jgi:PAS domain S-box-containing protein